MRTPPKLAIPESADSVSAEVRRLLRAAEVGDRLPTPRADILACAKLVETGIIDLAEFEQTRTQRLSEFFYRTLGKIRGFLDRRTEEIYVDPQLHQSKRMFVTYHEVTHSILPWQRLQYTEDDGHTLSAECVVGFECEANYGAAEIMFQCDRFESEAREFELSIASALHLADKYEASYHSAIRRFVERNHRPCMLLVLKPTTRVNPGGGTSFIVSHSILSSTFFLEFGEPLSDRFINPENELGRILNSGGTGEMNISNLKGFSQTCNVEHFTNQYKHFVLVCPKSVAPARRKVIRTSAIVIPGTSASRRFGIRM